MRAAHRTTLAVLFLAACAAPLAAQRSRDVDNDRWLDDCKHNDWGDDRGRACEVREVAAKITGHAIDIDGRENGSIHVIGGIGEAVRVVARLQASARSDADAQAILKDIRIDADGRRISADGPRNYRSDNWSVSYIVYVPRSFDLNLDAHNGSLAVEGVTGRMDLRTTNGSLHLTEVGGDVRAHTQNGSVSVELAGKHWDGAGLDAETQNGSVRLGIPADYAAQIETGTVNGRMNTDFPVTLQGRIGRSLSLPLNGGGTVLRVSTTNGSVSLMRR